MSSEVYGYCNGLFLFGIYVDHSRSGVGKLTEFGLWNPFTRRYKVILGCPVQSNVAKHSNFSLGFDYALDDHKIVIVSEFIEDLNEGLVCFPVWVFSLKSNFWRQIQDAPLLFYNHSITAGDLNSCYASFANGALYWPRDSDIHGLDLANEVIFSVKLVHACSAVFREYGRFSEVMEVFDDNLYTSKFLPSEGQTRRFYLRVRDECGGGAAGCWREAFALDEGIYRLLSQPLACSKTGDSILLLKERPLFLV